VTEQTNRLYQPTLADGDADILAISLQCADRHLDAVGAKFEIFEVERNELGSPERASNPDRKQRAIPAGSDAITLDRIDHGTNGLSVGRTSSSRIDPMPRSYFSQRFPDCLGGPARLRRREASYKMVVTDCGKTSTDRPGRRTTFRIGAQKRSDRVGIGGERCCFLPLAPGNEASPVACIGAPRSRGRCAPARLLVVFGAVEFGCVAPGALAKRAATCVIGVGALTRGSWRFFSRANGSAFPVQRRPRRLTLVGSTERRKTRSRSCTL